MTTGGEGGMVTTNDRELWSKIWSYKDHGKSWELVYEQEHDSGYRWLHTTFGTNLRMTEMQAVIGRIQLEHMAIWTAKRQANSQRIWAVARKYSALRVPAIPENIEHAAYKCYVFLDPEKSKWNRLQQYSYCDCGPHNEGPETRQQPRDRYRCIGDHS